MNEVRQRNLAGMRALLDTPTLSAMTGIPERTFDQHAYKVTGPVFVKLGRHRRYRAEDVEAWIEANRQGGDPGGAAA